MLRTIWEEEVEKTQFIYQKRQHPHVNMMSRKTSEIRTRALENWDDLVDKKVIAETSSPDMPQEKDRDDAKPDGIMKGQGMNNT